MFVEQYSFKAHCQQNYRLFSLTFISYFCFLALCRIPPPHFHFALATGSLCRLCTYLCHHNKYQIFDLEDYFSYINLVIFHSLYFILYSYFIYSHFFCRLFSVYRRLMIWRKLSCTTSPRRWRLWTELCFQSFCESFSLNIEVLLVEAAGFIHCRRRDQCGHVGHCAFNCETYPITWPVRNF